MLISAGADFNIAEIVQVGMCTSLKKQLSEVEKAPCTPAVAGGAAGSQFHGAPWQSHVCPLAPARCAKV